MTPTSPKWNAKLLMISLAGLGEARGEGEDSDGDSVGVGSVLGDVITAGSEGLVSGEFVACCWLNVQPAETSTSVANVTTNRHKPRSIVPTLFYSEVYVETETTGPI